MWATPWMHLGGTLLTLTLAVCELAYGGTVPLPADVKTGLLKKHNDLRRSANSKTRLQPLKWNAKLQSLAERVAGKCYFGHSDAGNKGIPGTTGWRHNKAANGFDYVGENAAYHSAKILNADLADGWGNEEKDYDIVTNKCAKSKVCGHYTQQVWNATTDVGCAFSDCPNHPKWKTMLYCEYGPGGNMRGQWPYVPAEPASTTESYSNRTSLASTNNVPNKSPQIVTASMIFTFVIIF